MRLWLALPAVALVLFACGGADETAVGKGGLGGTGGAGGGGCVDGDACGVPGKLGVCAAGKLTCGSDGTKTCTGPDPGTETCNGLDDDCNGVADEGCQLSLVVHGADGSVLTQLKTNAFPVNGRSTTALADVLGADPGSGWLEITSDSPLPVGGTFFVQPSAGLSPHALMPTVAPKQAAKSIVLPAYHQGGLSPAFSHVLDIVNPGDAAATATFHAVPDGAMAHPDVTKPIPAHGVLRTSVPDLFGLDPTQGEAGWLRVDGDQPLVMAYREERTDEPDVAGEAGWALPAKSLVVPYFLLGPSSDTVLRLANDGMADATVTLRAHPSAGTPIEATVTVPAGARLGADLAAAFPQLTGSNTEGFVELSASSEVAAMGNVIDGTHGGHALVGAVAAGATELELADAVANGAETTELTLGNPGSQAVTATLAAYAEDGALAAHTSVVLGPGGAFTGNLTSLLGVASYAGWVKITAEQPIVGAYARWNGDAGVGVTALQSALEKTAYVPEVQSVADGYTTTITIVQPDRR